LCRLKLAPVPAWFAVALIRKGFIMFYKTMLVHVDESRQLGRRVEVAARLALRADAHLVGVAATGIGHGAPAAAPGAADPAALRRRLQAALGKFEVDARAVGVMSCEQRLIDDDAAVALGKQGLYADLIVLGQGEAGSTGGSVDFPEYVVLNSACPVLIVPAAAQLASLGQRVLVAWNGSRAAARALRDALPFLQRAASVLIAVIETPLAGGGPDEQSGAALLALLARHGIKAEVVRRSVQDDAGHGLLGLVAELDCDMLVMGCVAHLHTRRMTLGGTTGTVLTSPTVAVLMSH
jgi:nucleotide-binding universal stress UspA family protein